MERRITEEQLTKAILDWLEQNDWNIICFDFPQSGTGVTLHPNEELRTSKNKGTFIPDIVARKRDTVIFFENKDRFVQDDILKINSLRLHKDYSNSIRRLLIGFNYSNIFYGIGLVHSDNAEHKINNQLNKVDFVVFYHKDKKIRVHFDQHEIFI